MRFVVKTEKGEKVLSLVLYSSFRRVWKYFVLCGIAITATIYASTFGKSRGENLTTTLRGKLPYKNVALRPIESRPDPNKWASLTTDEMEEKYLKCDWEKERQPHDNDTWIGMREAYISIVGKDEATVELDAERTFDTAFQIPFEIRQAPGKGRGIFALEDAPKGSILYDFTHSAQFRKGSDFAEFLRIIKPNLACDVLMWSYVQNFGKSEYIDGTSNKEALRIVTDLDPGCFCNSDGDEEGNMAWLSPSGEVAEEWEEYPPPAKITRKNGSVRQDAVKSAPLVATKDIKRGDELLCIYGQFSEGMGLMIK